MNSRRERFDRNVFINCPFDQDYLPLARALVFSILKLGFEPRLATERADSGEDRQKNKLCLILERERYRYQKVLSDISGNDIRAHQNDLECLIRELRNWFFVSTGELLPAADRKRDVQALEMAEYINYVRNWLPSAGAA